MIGPEPLPPAPPGVGSLCFGAGGCEQRQERDRLTNLAFICFPLLGFVAIALWQWLCQSQRPEDLSRRVRVTDRIDQGNDGIVMGTTGRVAAPRQWGVGDTRIRKCEQPCGGSKRMRGSVEAPARD